LIEPFYLKEVPGSLKGKNPIPEKMRSKNRLQKWWL